MIKKKEVEHLTKLARITLTEEEKKSFQKELSSVLDYFNLLNKIDISQVETFCFSLKNVTRKDEIEVFSEAKELIKMTPGDISKEGYLKTKEILKRKKE